MLGWLKERSRVVPESAIALQKTSKTKRSPVMEE